MEVMICVPKGTDISLLEKKYPDIYEDEGYEDHQRYFVGQSLEEEYGESFLTYNECVECCGFVAGAIKESETMIEGNGGWAQGMISRTDFSGYAVSPQQKAAWKKRSNLYWKAFRRGRRCASRVTKKQHEPSTNQSL